MFSLLRDEESGICRWKWICKYLHQLSKLENFPGDLVPQPFLLLPVRCVQQASHKIFFLIFWNLKFLPLLCPCLALHLYLQSSFPKYFFRLQFSALHLPSIGSLVLLTPPEPSSSLLSLAATSLSQTAQSKHPSYFISSDRSFWRYHALLETHMAPRHFLHFSSSPELSSSLLLLAAQSKPNCIAWYGGRKLNIKIAMCQLQFPGRLQGMLTSWCAPSKRAR